MSILDPVQKTLAPDIWKDGKLFPDVRAQLLNKLYSFLDKSNVVRAHILGTIVGYQYKDDSDVDIQVIVTPPNLAEHGPGTLIRKIQKEINGEKVNNTKHPINFFLNPYRGEEFLPDWSTFEYGVYNLLEDRWENDPGSPEEIRDPKLEYGIELNTAAMYLRKFENLVRKWESDLDRLKELSDDDSSFAIYNKKLLDEEIKKDFNSLVEFCHWIDRERKLEYSLGWGTPRKNWRNIIFKIMETSIYKDYFEFFKEWKSDDCYTTFYKILHEPIKDKTPLVSYRLAKY